jgi:hypothetical protein
MLSLILFYDDKIVQLSYSTENKLFTRTYTVVTPTIFAINKIYYNDRTEWTIIDDNHNVYNVRVNINLTINNVVITPLYFDHGVADIVCRSYTNDYTYLSTNDLLYNGEGRLLSNEILTRKITRATKSANFICNASS